MKRKNITILDKDEKYRPMVIVNVPVEVTKEQVQCIIDTVKDKIPDWTMDDVYAEFPRDWVVTSCDSIEVVYA